MRTEWLRRVPLVGDRIADRFMARRTAKMYKRLAEEYAGVIMPDEIGTYRSTRFILTDYPEHEYKVNDR